MHQVVFNPNLVTAATLMDFFFTIHDPTTLNSQGIPHVVVVEFDCVPVPNGMLLCWTGADHGTQYRSMGKYLKLTPFTLTSLKYHMHTNYGCEFPL